LVGIGAVTGTDDLRQFFSHALRLAHAHPPPDRPRRHFRTAAADLDDPCTRFGPTELTLGELARRRRDETAEDDRLRNHGVLALLPRSGPELAARNTVPVPHRDRVRVHGVEGDDVG